MGNQALNSLALVSARYILDALQVLTWLSAAHLLALCQAFGLRAMHLWFLETLSGHFADELKNAFLKAWLPSDTNVPETLWTEFANHFDNTGGINSSNRFEKIAKSLQPTIPHHSPKTAETLTCLDTWTNRFPSLATSLFNSKATYLSNLDATPYLRAASARMYTFVRKKLQVHFLQDATITTPKDEVEGSEFGSNNSRSDIQTWGSIDQSASPSMGCFVTAVYEAMRSEEFYAVVGECLRAV